MLPDRSGADAQLSSLDGPATLALCNTLADYGEAGALSHELMLRAGHYATTQFTTDLEVLLAAARMYELGGELVLARKVLIRAGKLAPEEARTLRQLGEVLRGLGLPITPALVIAEAESELATAPTMAPEAAAASKKPEVPRTPPSGEADEVTSALGEKSAPRPIASVTAPEGPTRISQVTTRLMPALEREPGLLDDDEFPAAATSESARSLAAQGGAPIRRVSSGTLRAAEVAASQPARPTLRNQARFGSPGGEPRSASGALRLPHNLRTPSVTLPSEGMRSPLSQRVGDSVRARERVATTGHERAFARASDPPRGFESGRLPRRRDPCAPAGSASSIPAIRRGASVVTS